jgi:hypothetical protein
MRRKRSGRPTRAGHFGRLSLRAFRYRGEAEGAGVAGAAGSGFETFVVATGALGFSA